MRGKAQKKEWKNRDKKLEEGRSKVKIILVLNVM
jgi:hypothetical protein